MSDADLSGADLRGAYLRGADLRRADLQGAALINANLIGANLSEANLSGADLLEADLSTADLSGAKLNGTFLVETILTAMKLYGTTFDRAVLFATYFADVDLSSAIGLETADHRGACTIDHRTLRKSGQLPLSFLRGVGLPDKYIDYIPSLFDQAIQFYSCFISYSTRDQEFANRLHADLQNKGIRCWFAPHDLSIGAKTWDAIDEAIRLRDKVLLVLSEHSIASEWVEDEVSNGFAEECKRNTLVLFPIRLDNTVMDTTEAWALKLRDQRNIGDFRQWKDHDAYKRSLERIVRDLTMQQAATPKPPLEERTASER